MTLKGLKHIFAIFFFFFWCEKFQMFFCRDPVYGAMKHLGVSCNPKIILQELQYFLKISISIRMIPSFMWKGLRDDIAVQESLILPECGVNLT